MTAPTSARRAGRRATILEVGGVRARLGQELRAHWRAMVGLTLLIGVLGGVVMATAAGARRTGTAFDRFLDESRAEDILLGLYAPSEPKYQRALDALVAMPVVDEIAPGAAMALVPDGAGRRIADSVAPIDDRLLHDINRPNVLEGRMPDPVREDEIMVNPAFRDEFGAEVGEVMRFWGFHEGDLYAHPGADPATYGEPRDLLVTGVGVLPPHVVPLSQFDSFPIVMTTPAYVAAHPDEQFSYSYVWIRLRNGADDNREFEALLDEALDDLEVDEQFVPVLRGSDRRAGVNRAIRPQAHALAVFSLMLGLVTVFVVGQLLIRHLQADQVDRRRLWALGFTRGELLAVALLRTLLILAGAVVVALALAVALSSRFPIGPARLAETSPGTEVNLLVLGLGAVVIPLVFVAIAAVSVRRSLPRPGTSPDGDPAGGPVRRSRIAAALSQAGVKSTCVIGTRMAFERGQGSNAVPAVGAIVALGMAVGFLAAAYTFSVNLDRLVETKALYGWTWDVQVGTGFVELPLDHARPALDEVGVVEYSGANLGRLQVAVPDEPETVESVPAVGIDQLEGSIYPRLIEGRAAADDGEIVLGSRVADRLGVGVGDQVEAAELGDERSLRRVVGLAVLPGLGAGIFSTTDLGEGAVVPASALAQDPADPYTLYLVQLGPGVDQDDAVATLGERFESIDPNCTGPACVQLDLKPPGIKNYERMRSTPLTLAAVLALLAVVTLATNLITSVHRRRRDFAVLRSVGYLRRQVAAACAWQAAAVALVALAVGVPLGVAAGRQLWIGFAEGAGAAVAPEVPIGAIVLAIPLTVLLAVVIAAWPARTASRVPAALVLRTE